MLTISHLTEYVNYRHASLINFSYTYCPVHQPDDHAH